MRTAENFCKINAMAELLIIFNILTLPRFKENNYALMLDALGMKNIGDKSVNAIEQEALKLLCEVCYSGSYVCVDSDKAIIPREFCVLKTLNYVGCIDVNPEYFLMSQQFERILEKRTNITRKEFNIIVNKYNVLEPRKTKRTSLLGFKNLRKINLDLLESII